MNHSYGLKSLWEEIIRDIERTSILYSKVNKAISFGLSYKLRIEAAAQLMRNKVILDAGCGPGDMTITIMNTRNKDTRYIIGLDADYNLLEIFMKRLDENNYYNVDLVVGLFEETPIRDMSVEAIVTSFSLRDSIDLITAVQKLSKTLKPGGQYVNIDIGKPSNPLVKEIFHIFLRIVPPIIASFYYGSIRNPWIRLYKTIDGIPNNKILERLISKHYKYIKLNEVAYGGLIKVIAIK